MAKYAKILLGFPAFNFPTIYRDSIQEERWGQFAVGSKHGKTDRRVAVDRSIFMISGKCRRSRWKIMKLEERDSTRLQLNFNYSLGAQRGEFFLRRSNPGGAEPFPFIAPLRNKDGTPVTDAGRNNGGEA